MAKLIILSIVFMSFLIPIRYSTQPNPQKSLKRVQVILLIFIVVWSVLCLRWYPALVPLE